MGMHGHFPLDNRTSPEFFPHFNTDTLQLLPLPPLLWCVIYRGKQQHLPNNHFLLPFPQKFPQLVLVGTNLNSISFVSSIQQLTVWEGSLDRLLSLPDLSCWCT